jgi:caa(3)-type oxidase subunit IV
VVFVAVLCTTSADDRHLVLRTSATAGRLKVAIILAIAVVNAFLVAGYLMHLLSEKKLIYTVLAFTVFFFIGLMGLTIWATTVFRRHGFALN